MIGISDLQQIQVIVKLPLHQLLWKSSTRSLLTAGSSTLDMCSTCCILVTKTTASTGNDTKRVKLILVHSVVYIYVVHTGIDFRRWYALIGSQSDMQQLDLSAYSWNEPSEENVNKKNIPQV